MIHLFSILIETGAQKKRPKLTVVERPSHSYQPHAARPAGRSARHLEVLRRLLAAIFNNLIFDHLPFIEGTQARTFNRGDMNAPLDRVHVFTDARHDGTEHDGADRSCNMRLRTLRSRL